MKAFYDIDDGYTPRASIEVFDRESECTVTYRNEAGDRFRLVFRKKPNPIGFHAVLPGDKR